MSIVERTRAAVRRDPDAGVTLVEIMVALTLLTTLTLSVGAGLMAIQKSALRSKERSAAANLATREVEIVRNWFHSADSAPAAVMAAGDVTNADPLPGQTGAAVVDNVPYTVKREVAWLITGNGISACDGGSVVSYPSVSVHVAVTWPNMGGVPPVVSDTILTPPKSVINASSAYLAIKVVDRDGAVSEGHVVSVTGPSGSSSDTTGPDGCATFVLSTAGSYTASVTEGASGYVSFNGATSQTATIASGSLTVLKFSYDLGEKFTTTLTPPTGFSLPVTLPALAFGNSGIQPSGISTFASTAGGTTTVGPLWPFASGYSIWAGSCPGSDPGQTGTRPAALTPAKGSTTATTAALQGVAVTTTRLGLPVSGIAVTATYAGTGTCTSTDSVINLGTSAGGVLNSSLPYGNWNLTATINGQALTPTPITVSSTSAVAVTLNGTV